MSVISVGDVTVHVQRFSGWDLPPFAQAVRILSDGTSANNEVLQSGASPRRRSTLAGWLTDPDDVATLDGYNESKEAVVVAEDADTRNANVLAFQVERSRPWLYNFTLQLIEADSGS